MDTIWTVGHSTLSLSEFLNLVQDIEVLADIRRFPGSRRFPHFCRESLQSVKPYQWFETLGGRRTGGEERHQALRNKAFRAYAAHMETLPFRDAVQDLERLARQRRTALLCAEGPWFRCHRMILSDLLLARGWEVRHLPGNRIHLLTQGGRLTDGRVVYDLEGA